MGEGERTIAPAGGAQRWGRRDERWGAEGECGAAPVAPQEDPLGLWMGKRMSRTEVVVEKRLYAMR